MLSQKNVLVLGSRPNSVLPDLQVSSIYAANGAAERAKIYKEKYPNAPLICCAGASEFARNENAKSRIKQRKTPTADLTKFCDRNDITSILRIGSDMYSRTHSLIA